jgi:hypothetical protein
MFGGMKVAVTNWLDTRERFDIRRVALALFCASFVGVTQADSVQVNVDRVPSFCARLLSQVRQDRIPSMTTEQLCRYDFMQRHAGGDYPSLDWQPVTGDPVALTMKIYDANMMEVMPLRGPAVKEREAILAYAQEQDRHHALLVDEAPFTLHLLGKTAGIQGFVLRSRGSYCEVAKGHERVEVKGLSSVAFFEDREMEHPLPDLGRTGVGKSYPAKYMVVGIDTQLLRYHGLDVSGKGPSYSVDVENVGLADDSQGHKGSWRLSVEPVCDYTIYVKRRVQ